MSTVDMALTDSSIERVLGELPYWAYDEQRRALYRRLEFTDFRSAFAALMQVAIEAEKVDHHPEWANVYNRVDIWLTTHDTGGVSERDVAMARYIDRLVTDREQFKHEHQ